MENQKIVDEFRKDFVEEIKDFNSFWYEGERFMYRPFVGYVHSPYKSKTFNINKEGFRGDIHTPKKASEDMPKRVAFFGSSALVGIPNTKDSNTIPELTKKLCIEKGLTIDVLNFGLICGTIKHELKLILQVISEYDVDMVILLSGYNDLHRSYLGEVWSSYSDLENIFLDSFTQNKNRDRIRYNLKKVIKSVFQKFKMKIYKFKKIDIATELQSKARKEFSKKRVVPTYNINRKIYPLFLNQIVSAVKCTQIPLVFCHQPSLYSTNKQLSKYELAYLEIAEEFGLFKDSDKEYEIEVFRKEYNLQKEKMNNIAKLHGKNS